MDTLQLVCLFPEASARVAKSATLKSSIRDGVQKDFIRHNNTGRVMSSGIHFRPSSSTQNARTHTHIKNVQNAVVESTSIVGTIEAINLRNTTR